MKSRYVMTVLLALSLGACNDWLEIEPESDLLSESYWKSDVDARVGVISIYNQFSQAVKSGLWDWGEARSDNFIAGDKNTQDQQELVANNIPIDNPAARWTSLYAAIGQANTAIKYIPRIDMNEAEKADLMAQAYALRAWSYFYCVRVWGNVPLYLEPVESVNDGIYRTREDRDFIMNRVIIPDLEKAYDGIDPANDKTKSRRVRINVATVCALLMDAYAWKHDYEKVIDVYEQRVSRLDADWTSLVAERTGGFTPNWRKMFWESTAAETPPEIWFKVAFDYYGNGLNSAVSYLASSTARLLVAPKLTDTDVVYAAGDFRKADQWTSARLRKKFWDDGTSFSSTSEDGVFSDIDLTMYRYADAVLLYAEALNEVGRTTDAVTALNRTYARAGNTPFTVNAFPAYKSLRDAILLERQREFLGEGKRWFDLLRTDTWMENRDTPYPNCNLTDARRTLFPVHRDHLNQNPNLDQNEGYPRP
jgi:tetratricopeptide (TPR) repeat protein